MAVVRSSPPDRDLTAVNACVRSASGERRRTAASGGGEARDRVWGLDFMRSLHREIARVTGKLARAARPAEARRGRRLTRRGGGATSATTPRRYGPRARRQAAPASSSPSCATPERLLVGGKVTTARDGCGDARVRVPAARVRALRGG
jgi:hypothetical protein